MKGTLKQAKTSSARVVERSVKAPQKGLEVFQSLLRRLILNKRTPESQVRAIVDAALVSEFGEHIQSAEYYPRMQEFVVKTLLKEASLKKQVLQIADKYKLEK